MLVTGFAEFEKLLGVVPAKAGTHNHRWMFRDGLGPQPRANTGIGGYGSPPSGTTVERTHKKPLC
jgi:hypothetical protein